MPRITISATTHEALDEYNRRAVGRGASGGDTTWNDDGTVTITLEDATLERLREFAPDGDLDAAILRAIERRVKPN